VSDFLKRFFNVENPKMVTRKQLTRSLESFNQIIDDLTIRLYIQNDRLPMFKRLDENHRNVLIKIKSLVANTPRDFIADTGDFAERFGLEKQRSSMRDRNFTGFRIDCLHEEVDELETALFNHDDAGALDALVDLAYFLFGTVRAFDLECVFNEAWKRVHEANLRKVRVERTDQSKRGSIFDVVKPEGWVAPDLLDLVAEEQETIDESI
jgi:predicted HAD superfamily Cof-like phosphohydrolase